jgi:hypothetical protein
MKKFRIHWSVHPHRDLEWYQGQCDRLTRDAIAKDLDINYVGSVTGQVFPEFNNHKHVTTKFPKLSTTKPIYRIWDFGNTNYTLYVYMDSYHRKYFLHERLLLPNSTDGNSTDAQAELALADTEEMFSGFEIIDICDPAGKVKNYNSDSSDVELLRSYGIHPRYERIMSLPTKTRKDNARKTFQSDLQKAPGGKEKIVIYHNGTEGCTTLVKALAGGYCYKKDGNGNITSTIHEKHPYEDAMDCVYYFYQEAEYDNHEFYENLEIVSNNITDGVYF